MQPLKPFSYKYTIIELIINSLCESSKTYTCLKNDVGKLDTPVARGLKRLIESDIIIKNSLGEYTINKLNADFSKIMERRSFFKQYFEICKFECL